MHGEGKRSQEYVTGGAAHAAVGTSSGKFGLRSERANVR